jgi:hypothetical protein
MQTQNLTDGKSTRQLVYMVVGRPIDNTYTEQANVLLFTTTDREVAQAKADERNKIQNKYLFEVVDTELVTRQTIIEDRLIIPMVRLLQEFVEDYKFITNTELTNAIEQLLFSEEVTKLLQIDSNSTDSSNDNSTVDDGTPLELN